MHSGLGDVQAGSVLQMHFADPAGPMQVWRGLGQATPFAYP